MMPNILKQTYQASNFKPNSEVYEFTTVIDTDINTSDIGLYLPNNGSRYKTVSDIGYVPSGSSATVYTPTNMIVCSFVAEFGSVDSKTNWNEGVWKCLASVPYQ